MKEENKKNESLNEVIEEHKEQPKSKSDTFWKLAVLVMFVMVGAQTFFIYSMLDKNRPQATMAPPPPDSFVLAPRAMPPTPAPALRQNRPSNTPVCQNQAPSCQNLPIPPLPKLNVNVNKQGVPAAITPGRQYQTQQLPQSPFNSFPQGFSINIGPGMGMMQMDMRKEMERMERLMNSFFKMGGMARMHAAIPRPNGYGMSSRSFAVSSPSISQNSKEYVVKLKIPGVDKSEVKARIQGNLLTISGTKKMESDNQGKNGRSFISSYSSFQNSFPLPGPVKADKMKMEYNNDTLTIKIPKA